MTGNDLIEIVYLVAIPVQNNAKKVQVFSEHGVIMLSAIGVNSQSSYLKLLGARNYKKLEEHCEWDDKFDRWKVKATMKWSVPVKVVNQDKYSNKSAPKTNLPLETLSKNMEIKKIGDAMTENEVLRLEHKTLKDTGRPTVSRRYEKLD